MACHPSCYANPAGCELIVGRTDSCEDRMRRVRCRLTLVHEIAGLRCRMPLCGATLSRPVRANLWVRPNPGMSCETTTASSCSASSGCTAAHEYVFACMAEAGVMVMMEASSRRRLPRISSHNAAHTARSKGLPLAAPKQRSRCSRCPVLDVCRRKWCSRPHPEPVVTRDTQRLCFGDASGVAGLCQRGGRRIADSAAAPRARGALEVHLHALDAAEPRVGVG